ASVLFPPQIVQGYCDGNTLKAEDPAIEALWKALPDTVGGENNSIVVADGSGSMLGMIGKTNVSALNVANSIAIYFAERASGLFKNKFITFSERPQFVDLSKGKSLREKIQIAMLHSEVANTNIEAVFELILSTAIRGQMTQSDLPKNIIIISDMEFDACVTLTLNTRPDSRLFDVVKDKYKRHNYKLPRLVFWNVNSRTGTIPVIENSLGVALVSGFSTNIVRMILNGSKLDPYEALVESLNVERYAPIEEALKEAGVC
ncbi:MAG: DUF2828 family protein, partial [Clostridiales bacterium]|nr:DUF2828 family protein [Clostridiales bacterium]